MALTKQERRSRIKKRIRKNLTGTGEVPRMSVFRSNKQIYVQLINDLTGETIVSAASTEKGIAGENGYLYHGRIKSLADAARENGLKF